ncbi:SRPBCC domain-containing protein [Agromyces sp. NPDC056523]|uniref:SRPBCC family protein n=1 Tax=Agromyces sp. NPDC056523 TaxID=3345850 RepID=UPI00366C78D8
MPSRTTLRDSFDLPLSRGVAFRLFTARGEQLWVPGWTPRFFADVEDDLAVGTVWRTDDDAGRPTTWIVLDADPPSRVRYARVAEAWTAGTVTVSLTETTSGCRVTVEYDLTAIHPDAAAELDRFADGYPTYLGSWRDAILDHLDSGGPMPDPV